MIARLKGRERGLAAVVGLVAAAGAAGAAPRDGRGDWEASLTYVPCMGGVVAIPEKSGRLVWAGVDAPERTLYPVPGGGSLSLRMPGGVACTADGRELAVVARRGTAPAELVILAAGRAPETYVVPGADGVAWLDGESAVVPVTGGGAVALFYVDRKAKSVREAARWVDLLGGPPAVVRVGRVLHWLRREIAGGETVHESAADAGPSPVRVVKRFPAGTEVALAADGSSGLAPVRDLSGVGPMGPADPRAIHEPTGRVAYAVATTGELRIVAKGEKPRVRIVPAVPGATRDRIAWAADGSMVYWVQTLIRSARFGAHHATREYDVLREVWALAGAPELAGDAKPYKILTLLDGIEVFIVHPRKPSAAR